MEFTLPPKDSFAVLKRLGNEADPYSSNEEQIRVSGKRAILKEIPDKFSKVLVKTTSNVSLIESITMNNLSNNDYYVDYQSGIIYFHSDQEGKILNFSYKGTGYFLVPSNRVFIQNDDNSVQTAEDKFNKLSTDIQTQKVRIDTQINSVPQPSEVLDTRVDRNGNVYSVVKERIDAEQKKIEDTFNASDGRIYNSLAERMNAERNEFNDHKTDINNQLNDAKVESDGTINATLKDRLNKKDTQTSLKFDAVNSQLAEMSTKTDGYKINVLYPPKDLNASPVVADGQTITTNKINDILSKGKGNHIYFPDGTYLIDNSLIVFDDTTIELSKNALIQFTPNVTSAYGGDYISPHIFKNDLTNGLSNIEIFGGTIDGNGTTALVHDAHRAIWMQGVNGLKIHDIKIQNIAGWGISHWNCLNFHFYNITLDQRPYSVYSYNGDGISGASSDGVIENIRGYVSDDLVSLHAGCDNAKNNGVVISVGNVTNVTINGLYPQKKIWTDSNSVQHTETPYRAIGLYVYKNATLDRIDIDNIDGETMREILVTTPYYSSSYGNIGTIRLNNVNLKVISSAEATYECFWIRDVIVDTIYLNNCKFYDLDGINVNSAIQMVNTTVNNLIINNLYSNKLTSDQPFIVDSGTIKNLVVNGIQVVNNASPGTGYFYKKQTSDLTTVTNIYALNFNSNLQEFVTVTSGQKIRMCSPNVLITQSKANAQQSNDIVHTENGLMFYDGSNFIQLNKPTNWNITANGTYTLTKPQTVTIGATCTAVTIKLSTNLMVSGVEFKVSIPSGCNVSFQDANGTPIMTSGTFNGASVYSILGNVANFLYVQVATNRYLS